MSPWVAVTAAAAAGAGAFAAGARIGRLRALRVPGTLPDAVRRLLRRGVDLGFPAADVSRPGSRTAQGAPQRSGTGLPYGEPAEDGAAPPGAPARDAGGLAGDMERFRFWLDEQWRRSEEERQRLAAVLAGLTEGIVLLDRYGRVLLSNDVARSLWPRLSPRVRGRHRIEIFGDAGCDRALSEALATGEPRQAELARPGPPSRRFRVRALPIPADQAPSLEAAAGAARGGGAAGAVVVVEDVTRQHALDQIRRDFVANVSHELQTPLTSVRGYAETLLADEALEEGQRQHFLRHILRESERMTSLVRDLLALAQLEAPRQVEAEPVDLAALVRTIVGAADGRARAQGLSLAYEADPAGEAGVVAGRAEELRRAIDNLVGNALAYTPAGGAIRVRVERRGAETAVSVSDTGIGIPAEAVPRIFERFYRVDRGRSRNTGGTGLGLAIVKHTAEGHGGRVEVASVPGQGSTFTLLLPAAPPGSPSPSALPPPGTRTG